MGDSSSSDQESSPLTPPSPVGDLNNEAQPKALISWIVTSFLLLQARYHILNFVVQIIFSFLKKCLWFWVVYTIHASDLENFILQLFTKLQKIWN